MEPDDDAMTDSTKGEGTLAHPISRLDTDGIPLNLASGISAFLLPSCVAPLPEAPASIISRFGYIGEECSVSVTDWWMSMPPGRRPDTLVVKGLPCEWFELTLSTLDRERVISACSRLRRVLESFGAVRDLDVRPHEPDDPLQRTIREDKWTTNGDLETAARSQLPQQPFLSQRDHCLANRSVPLPNALSLFEEEHNASNVRRDNSTGNSDEPIQMYAKNTRNAAGERMSLCRDAESQINITAQVNSSAESESVASTILSLYKPDMFQAIVQYRTYEGFVETMRMLGGKDLLHVDMNGVEAAAPLSVECDYKEYFSFENMKIRAAAERESIREAASRRIQEGRAELRFERRIRKAKQDARAALVGPELRIADITEIPETILQKDTQLISEAKAAKIAFEFTQTCAEAIGTVDNEATLKIVLNRLQDALDETERRILRVERRYRTVRDKAKLDLPDFDEALLSAGCSIFLELVKKNWSKLGLGPKIEGTKSARYQLFESMLKTLHHETNAV